MLRLTAPVFAVLALTSGAVAQGSAQLPTGPTVIEAPVDFILRPSQVDDEEEDIWDWDREEEPSLLETLIGPPLAGPTGDEAVGQPLFGPDAPPIEDERAQRGREEVDLFAPIGVRLGAFIIRPSIEIGFTATDNVTQTEGGPSAVGAVVVPELSISSGDDRYDVALDLSAEGIFYDQDDFNSRAASVRLSGRFDLSSVMTLLGEGGYSLDTQGFNDPDTPGGAAERPLVETYDATLGLERRFGRLTVGPSAFVERSINDDVPLVGGGEASRRELDVLEYGGGMRTSFALGAGITPFVETTIGRRDFDQEVDDSGFRRSSVWGELIGGVAINRGSKLSGEISLGYYHEDLEDGSLPDIDAVLAEVAILWSPRRLTEVEVSLTTDVQTTSTAGESGSVVYAGLVTVSRLVTPRIRLAAGGGIEYEYAVGGDREDVTFTGFAEASYAFNRTASVAARYEYEQEESNEAGGDSQSHTVGVRLRLQH